MIPYLVAAITTPFIGYFADTFGRRSLLIIITSGFFLLTHILFLFKMCDQVCAKITLPLVILGNFPLMKASASVSTPQSSFPQYQS